MRDCFLKGIGILVIVCAISMLLALILPAKWLVFILTGIIIYIGILLFLNC